MHPRETLRIAAALALSLLAAAPLAGCRGDRTDKPPRRFFPDMDDQQRWDPQESTGFYADQRTLRTPVVGTVAFGNAPFDPEAHGDQPWARGFITEREAMLAEDDATYRGFTLRDDGTENWVDYVPVEVTTDLIERGRERFNIYCSACHGFIGQGDGMVGKKWSYPPANLLGEAYTDRANRQGKDGYLFHVIREGVWDPASGANRMPAYKNKVGVHDAWAIVAYLRVLQESQSADFESLPPAEKERLAPGRAASGSVSAAEPDAPAAPIAVAEGGMP